MLQLTIYQLGTDKNSFNGTVVRRILDNLVWIVWIGNIDKLLVDSGVKNLFL